jgi:hypothetical protein
MRDGLDVGHRKDYYPCAQLPYLGDQVFVDRLRDEHSRMADRQSMMKGIPDNKEIDQLSTIVAQIALQGDVPIASIRGKSRQGKISALRKAFIRQAAKEGYAPTMIARFINCSQGYITKVMKWVSAA